MRKKKGLEPLAEWLLTFPKEGSLEEEAINILSDEKEVSSIEDVLKVLKILLQNGFLMKLKVVNGLEEKQVKRESLNHL